jgi:hypothetical protein
MRSAKPSSRSRAVTPRELSLEKNCTWPAGSKMEGWVYIDSKPGMRKWKSWGTNRGRTNRGRTFPGAFSSYSRDTPSTEPCWVWLAPERAFARGPVHALYYTQRAVWRQDTSNSAKADITLSGPGFPLTPWYMPSCGVSRLKASSNRSRPSAWSRCSGPSHFTLRTGRASTRTCGMEESSSHVCETKLGVSIQRSILSWRPPGTGRQAPAHEAAVPG